MAARPAVFMDEPARILRGVPAPGSPRSDRDTARPTSDAHVAIGARGRLREMLERIADRTTVDRWLAGFEVPSSAVGVLRFVEEELLPNLERELGHERCTEWLVHLEEELGAAATVEIVDPDPVARAALARAFVREGIHVCGGPLATHVVRTPDGWRVEGSDEPPSSSISRVVRLAIEQIGAPVRTKVDTR